METEHFGDPPPELRRLPIDLEDVTIAMGVANSGMLHHYVDRETGEVLLISEDELEEQAEDRARIEAEPGRFIEVPPDDSHEAYRDMEDFAATAADARLQERLWWALNGPRPFRRFKDAVADDPTEEERWFCFRDERLIARAVAWLAEEGLAPERSPGEQPASG
jgi:hypothetical protein